MAPSGSSSPDFDAVYRGDPDPFRVGSSWYERRKQQVVLASLGREHYALAWDSACGTGHLAAELAERCDAVVATDASPRAVELTAQRLNGVGHVRTAVNALPEMPPSVAGADLVVLAEVLYYLPEAHRQLTVAAVARTPAEVLLVHWRHDPHDAWLSGADVQQEAVAGLVASGRVRAVHHDDVDFVLDVWSAPS